MNAPKYILRINEAVFMPVERNKIKYAIKIFVWVIVAVIILSSLIFQDNMFSELSWMSRAFLICLAVGFGFYGNKTELTPSHMELQFFNDYVVVYRPNRYYSRRVTRKEIIKINYCDISRCVLKTQAQRIHIYCGGVSTFFKLKSNGTFPQSPTEVRNFAEGLVYFDISFIKDVDIVKEIETHSPIKVIVENS
ncbi:MAG: hypothetical protein IJZ35_06810 [Clostridia bacterium]|nr:hypothetical protein [Clostridia bacterium]